MIDNDHNPDMNEMKMRGRFINDECFALHLDTTHADRLDNIITNCEHLIKVCKKLKKDRHGG